MTLNAQQNVIVVLGASRLGSRIASYRSLAGNYVTIVDKDAAAFRKLDEGYSGFRIFGNAEDMETLKKARIENAFETDIVTGDDNTNIYLACLVHHYFHCKRIFVRLNDEKKAQLLPNDASLFLISPSEASFETYLKEKEVPQ